MKEVCTIRPRTYVRYLSFGFVDSGLAGLLFAVATKAIAAAEPPASRDGEKVRQSIAAAVVAEGGLSSLEALNQVALTARGPYSRIAQGHHEPISKREFLVHSAEYPARQAGPNKKRVYNVSTTTSVPAVHLGTQFALPHAW
jgi:hypothetical protein